MAIKIRVHALIGNLTGLTVAKIQALFADVNAVYAQADVEFELASSEFITATPALTDENGAKGSGVEFHLARQMRAIQYPERLVVFFLGTGPQSSGWADYAMAGGHPMLFAHELGHYLHLPHTFNGTILTDIYETSKTQGFAAAKEVARNYIRTSGLSAFDGDSAVVTDTPPDPGPPLYQPSGYKPDGSALVTKEECSGDGKFTLDVDRETIVFAPDRKNIMSYFFACPGDHNVSPSQQVLVNLALTSLNRRHLANGSYPEGPASIAMGDQMHVFARGDDRNIWRSYWNGQKWSGWFNDAGVKTFTSGPAAAASGSEIHLFARGDDRNIWRTFWNGQKWSGWHGDIGAGTLTSGPAAVTLQQAIHVFARGDDRQIWNTFWNGQKWSGWRQDIGKGTVTSQPAAIVTAAGHLHVFARREDRNVWRTSWDGQKWSGWVDDLGKGTLTSAPGAVVSSGGNLHVFARGDDRAMWQTFWNGTTWSGWKANVAAGVFMTGAAAALTNDKKMHMFAQGDDRAIVNSIWNGQTWSAWTADLPARTFQP